TSSLRDLVIAIFNAQNRCAENAHLGFTLVGLGQPEVTDFLVATFEVSFDSPPGGVDGRLALDSSYREVLCIHPNVASKQKLVFASRLRIEHIEFVRIGLLVIR